MIIDINRYKLVKKWKIVFLLIKEKSLFDKEDLKNLFLISETLSISLFYQKTEDRPLHFTYLYTVIPCLFRDIFRELIILYFIEHHKNSKLKDMLNTPKWLDMSTNIDHRIVSSILKTNNIYDKFNSNWEGSLRYYQDKDSNKSLIHRHLTVHNPLLFQERVSTESYEIHIRHCTNLLSFLETLSKIN